MPPFAVCPGVPRLAVPARCAPRIPDVPDVVDDCRESGAKEGGTPGDGPPTTGPAPVAAASPVPARSPTNRHLFVTLPFATPWGKDYAKGDSRTTAETVLSQKG